MWPMRYTRAAMPLYAAVNVHRQKSLNRWGDNSV
jgi:hypothetical protein